MIQTHKIFIDKIMQLCKRKSNWILQFFIVKISQFIF